MAEPQYRYGGPIPERVQQLKARRVRRARERDAKSSAFSRSSGDEAWVRASLEPFVRCIAPSGSAMTEGRGPFRPASDSDTSR